jgi:hypothetical protein
MPTAKSSSTRSSTAAHIDGEVVHENHPEDDEVSFGESEPEDGETIDESEPDDEDLDAAEFLAQFFVTSEHGESVADVLNGIRENLDKTNKILYKLIQVAASDKK